jgi:lysophospholipase L1-like esterase
MGGGAIPRPVSGLSGLKAYIRRLDVVNRGFRFVPLSVVVDGRLTICSGYNTRHALAVLPHIIPSPDVARIRMLVRPCPMIAILKSRLLTHQVVFFGANDASLPDSPSKQHIPLPEFKDNLEKIITHPLVVAHSPRIILVAPPPVNEHPMWVYEQSQGLTSLARTAATTKSYADAAVQVGKKLGVPVVDLWKAFMAKARFDHEAWKTGDPIPGSLDMPPNDELVKLMHDGVFRRSTLHQSQCSQIAGLHFNPAGYDILFEEVVKVIAENWPDQLPGSLPMVFPAWNDSAGWEAWAASQKGSGETVP